MDNDNSQPLLVSGDLPKNCYADFNELVKDIAKVLRIPTDTISVIKGAEGEKGRSGNSGPRGPKGDKGDNSNPITKVIPIPISSTYVDFAHFAGYYGATYQIHHKGQIGSVDAEVPSYVAATAKVFAVGTIVKHALPANTTVRAHFVFPAGTTGVEDANHVLHITEIK